MHALPGKSPIPVLYLANAEINACGLHHLQLVAERMVVRNEILVLDPFFILLALLVHKSSVVPDQSLHFAKDEDERGADSMFNIHDNGRKVQSKLLVPFAKRSAPGTVTGSTVETPLFEARSNGPEGAQVKACESLREPDCFNVIMALSKFTQIQNERSRKCVRTWVGK